ncbi:MMPL family transporter [Actinoallomurus purpureus]|uniref:MMPL family transporter n=1 Tax=Actinoallomurus purpureus TaxID=478114 RepID=UPI0020933949|nr:MMPL family transporter [Actinoallomurus purpureus]MCO6009338.1 MMPL family transporter [Actinoallomurus purpureus]
MFAGLGRLVHRRRLSCLALCLAFMVVSGMWGSGAVARLKSGGFDDPHSSSSLVAKLSAQYFSNSTPDVFVIYRSDRLTVDDPRFRGSVTTALARLPKDKIRGVLTYWSQTPRIAELASKDRHATFAAVQLAGDDTAKTRAYDAIEGMFGAPGLNVRVGGGVPLAKEFNTQTQSDLARAEMISFPVLLVLMLFVFGSLGSFWLPLVVGVFSIVGALTVLRVLTMVTAISSFSAEVITMMGLGLAIDYSLFIVNRFREELGRGADRPTALANTMATAGRTIAFSGITVTTALAGLLLFPQMFLRSVGIGGMAVVAVAIVGALFLLPALLALLGPRVEFGRMPWRRRAAARSLRTPEAQRTSGPWYRLATSVMRHPILYFVGVMAILGASTTPFLHVRFGSTDVRVLPTSSPNRQLYEAFQREFPTGSKDPIDVVLSGDLVPKNFVPTKKKPVPSFITDYEDRLRHLPGVTSVEISGYAEKYAAVRISVRHQYGAMTDDAKDLVRRVRAVPLNRAALYADVGGGTAAQMDLMDSLRRGLPTVGAVIGLVTFLLLFMAFGSIVLPLKAVAMNLLSLGASFGAIVWGFQDGHLAGLLRFTSTGTTEPTTLILVLLTVFGLSMDYEVFLLSRVREEWDRTRDNTRSVAIGLQRTGGIISSAALLFLVVIAVFSTADITLVKLIGVGMFVAIVVDASLVRMLLVPATMRFLGPANWWLPRPLRALHTRVDLGEHDEPPAAEPTEPTGGTPAAERTPGPERNPAVESTQVRATAPVLVPALVPGGVPAPRVRRQAERLAELRAERRALRTVPERPATAESTDDTTGESTLADEILRRVAAVNGRTPVFRETREAAPGRSAPRPQREIVPNPDGPGWHWKTPED